MLYFHQSVAEIWSLPVNTLREMIAYRDMREKHINKKQAGSAEPRDPAAETQRTLAMLTQHGAAVDARNAKPQVRVV